ncbi:MAG: MFS transporter [Rhodobacteraceae bacterium]|nr:MFS transporter [Planctomycetales bacterium]MCB2106960.1 MFS transporter [Paracoccaceae bacterium]
MTMVSASTEQDETETSSALYAWFVVLAISLLQIGSHIDRQIITLLVEPMRRDFGVNDTQVSLLLGFAFALFYGVTAIPIGRLVDRFHRVRILVIAVIFWSLATLWCMLSDSYWSLFVARMMVGLGEAALIPAGFSILSDYFRPGRIASAISCVTGASFVGSGVALAFGGWVIDALPTSPTVVLPIVGEIRSWQLAFGFASIPSFVILVLFAFVREPKRRGAAPAESHVTIRDILKYLASDKQLWIAIFVGMSFINTFQYGITAWVPTFFMRTYGWTASEIGQIYGAGFIICGTLGTVSGGWLCDRLYDRIGRRAFVILPLASAAIVAPIIFVFAIAGNDTVSATLLFLLTYFGTISFGGAVGALPSLAPNRMRGQLVAAYMLLGTLIGQGGGPWIIAFFTDHVFGDPMLIRNSIASVSTSLLIGAVIVLFIGQRAIARHDAAAGAPGELVSRQHGH